MPDVLIRNIEEDILNKLKEKAEKNNRSLQGELHEILRSYVGPDIEEARNMVNEILTEYRAEGRTFSDSADDLREDRER
ncbi:MAG: FitA-like ribbon-helix-helix domain-containing protein [Balneola sp.]